MPIARSLGFELAYEEPHWGEQSFNINFPISEQHAFHAAFHAFEDRLQAAARLPQDTNAADWLAPGNHWNPLIDAVSTYVSGAELSNISAYDSTNYQDTNADALHARCPRYFAQAGKLDEAQLWPVAYSRSTTLTP